MALSQKRREQIAFVWLRHRMVSKGLKIHPNLHREIWSQIEELNKFDKDIKITDEEAIQMAEELVMEMVNSLFLNLKGRKKAKSAGFQQV